jgi:hypothetical protein
VRAADPEELRYAMEDRYNRSLSLRSSHHIIHKPTLSKRVKMLSHLHINIEPAAPNRLNDSF